VPFDEMIVGEMELKDCEDKARIDEMKTRGDFPVDESWNNANRGVAPLEPLPAAGDEKKGNKGDEINGSEWQPAEKASTDEKAVNEA
jgi:hypothetical protein